LHCQIPRNKGQNFYFEKIQAHFCSNLTAPVNYQKSFMIVLE